MILTSSNPLEEASIQLIRGIQQFLGIVAAATTVALILFLIVFLIQRVIFKNRYSLSNSILLGNLLIFVGVSIYMFLIAKDDLRAVKELTDYWLNTISSKENFIDSYIQWLYPFEFNRYVLLLGIVFFAVLFFYGAINMLSTPESEYKKRQKNQERRAQRRATKKGNINFNSRNHTLALGNTGSGKTANLLRYAENSIINEEFLVVIDGKGSDGKYSFHDVIEKLCKTYERKLIVVDQQHLDKTVSYNPFEYLKDPVKIKDMFSDYGEFSEPYYKNNLLRYIQGVADFLIKIDESITYNRIIELLETSEFTKLIAKAKADEKINEMDELKYKKIVTETSKEVKSSSSQFAMLMESPVGQAILNQENSTNLINACQEKSVLLIKLNSSDYSAFARQLGIMVLRDMVAFRNFIYQQKKTTPTTFIMDEISVYYSDIVIDILNKSRDADIRVLLSSQSLADFDKFNSNDTNIIINNCNNFIIMRMLDGTVERVSDIFGTKRSKSFTSQTNALGYTGRGTTTDAQEYVVNPNQIRNLGKNEGYYYEKDSNKPPTFFKTIFVNPNIKKKKSK